MGDERQADHGGRKKAAQVRRVAEETGADFFAAIGAVRRHGKDEGAARAELLRATSRAGAKREERAS